MCGLGLMRDEITVLILTFNEAPNIVRTLQRLEWAPRILLIDSFSSDDTIALAQRAHPNVVVAQRRFDSFAQQCNFGLTQITTDWVLSLDADYVLTRELVEEIRTLDPASEVAGYSAQFRYCIFGRPLRSTIYPPRTVLYRRTLARYRDEGHGHRVTVSGKVTELSSKIDHDDRKPLSHWLQSQNRYAIIEARHLRATPAAQLNFQDRLRRKILFAAPAIFLYLLIGRGSLLDGWRGWYYVCQRTFAELVLSLRLLTNRDTQ